MRFEYNYTIKRSIVSSNFDAKICGTKYKNDKIQEVEMIGQGSWIDSRSNSAMDFFFSPISLRKISHEENAKSLDIHSVLIFSPISNNFLRVRNLEI